MTEDPYTRVIRKLGLGVHPGSPDDPKYPEPEYFLVGKHRFWCPWCGAYVYDLPGGGSNHAKLPKKCEDWDYEQTVDTNRIRYAAERLEDLYHEP